MSQAERGNQTRILIRSPCHVRPKPSEDLVRPPNPPSSRPMAHQIPTYAQPHGTLAPGQTISVNKYTVQVERYLSQGKLHRLSCDRPFWNTTAHQLQPNYRRLCSRLSCTDFGAGLWDDTSCSQEDRRRERFDVDGCEEGGRHYGEYLLLWRWRCIYPVQSEY